MHASLDRGAPRLGLSSFLVRHGAVFARIGVEGLLGYLGVVPIAPASPVTWRPKAAHWG